MQLAPGANTALPQGDSVTLRLSVEHGHADLIALCVRDDGTADGDNGVALWSQPQCADGAVRIDTAADTVSIELARLPGDVRRVLVVAQADGAPDLAGAGRLSAQVAGPGGPVAQLLVEPPALPTVQVGEFYRHGGGWKVRCLGDGYADGLARLLQVHGIEVLDEPAAPSPAPASAIDLEKRRTVDIVKRVEATGSVSLTKKVRAAAVCLDKAGLAGQRAQVVLVLDVSGSARPLFKDGRYQVLIERALAAGLLFDDDGTIQAYLFDHDLHDAPEITLDNIGSWAQQVYTRRGIWGRTQYAGPIERIAGQVGRGQVVPTYVMFITDGGNSDRRAAADAMQRAAGCSVFWQFMAVGREQDFPFLRRLDDLTGREVDNADFFAVEDPAGVGDEEFFARLMNEFPGWLVAARRAGILT